MRVYATSVRTRPVFDEDDMPCIEVTMDGLNIREFLDNFSHAYWAKELYDMDSDEFAHGIGATVLKKLLKKAEA